MFLNSANKIVRYADVQCAVLLARENVDEIYVMTDHDHAWDLARFRNDKVLGPGSPKSRTCDFSVRDDSIYDSSNLSSRPERECEALSRRAGTQPERITHRH